MTNTTFVVLRCVILIIKVVISLTSRNKLVIVIEHYCLLIFINYTCSKNFGVPKFSVTKNFGDF